jgi:hypothetical protein
LEPDVPFTSGEVVVRRCGDDAWELVEDLVYEGRWDRFVVPASFVTDFATVPRVAVWLIPRFGRWTPSAILHDYLLEVGIPTGIITSRDADGIFRRILRELGVSGPRRWIMWCGVRYGALGSPRRRPGWWRDFPRVALITALAAPIVVPPAVLVLAALLVFGTVEWLSRPRTDTPIDLNT